MKIFFRASKMKRTQKTLIRNQKGQGLVEYLLILSLVAVGTIGIIRVLSQTVNAKFATVTSSLQGKQKSFEVESITDSHTRKKSMSDFFVGSAGRGGNDSPGE